MEIAIQIFVYMLIGFIFALVMVRVLELDPDDTDDTIWALMLWLCWPVVAVLALFAGAGYVLMHVSKWCFKRVAK